jgi:TatD DNase family protein
VYFIDTHTHLYAEEFAGDIITVVQRAIKNGVNKLMLPDIDSTTRNEMLNLSDKFPDVCLPMLGLHPTSVKENFKAELNLLNEEIGKNKYYGIGETGIDLYWDKTYYREQIESFTFQIEMALKYKLPIVIHSRKSLNEILSILKPYKNSGLSGIFHCFPGNLQEAEKVIEMGFFLGIGGVVTYKKASMAEVVKHFGLEHIVLETDSPYLSPAPYRGKRNESSFIRIISEFIAELLNTTIEKVADTTTVNARKIFRF